MKDEDKQKVGMAMSYQVAALKPEVGMKVQEMVDEGYQEILVQVDGDTPVEWSVTGDNQKFWGWLMTPSELEAVKKELPYLKVALKNNAKAEATLKCLIRAIEGDKSDL